MNSTRTTTTDKRKIEKIVILVKYHGTKIRFCRIITVISTSLPKTPENDVFLIMTMTSMIRQYDEKAADDILKFWFSKKSNKDDTEDYCSKIQFVKKEPPKETELMDMAAIV